MRLLDMMGVPIPSPAGELDFFNLFLKVPRRLLLLRMEEPDFFILAIAALRGMSVAPDEGGGDRDNTAWASVAGGGPRFFFACCLRRASIFPTK